MLVPKAFSLLFVWDAISGDNFLNEGGDSV